MAQRPPSPAETAGGDVGAELGARLPVVMSRLGRGLRRAYGPLGPSPGQFPVLTYLLSVPQATVSQLATRERVRLPSMTALVAQMEADGLVAKRADESDRRCVRVSLTPRGESVARSAAAARAAWFEVRLDHLSRSERAAIARAMSALEHLAGLEL